MWPEIIRTVGERMWALIGVLLGLVALHQAKSTAQRRIGKAAVWVFTVLFLVLAGTDVYEIVTRRRAADALADLQRNARKRYTEWWTHCQSPEKATTIKAEADAVRLQIIAVLRDRLTEAEAQSFNTPKAVEPFPNTTISACPQAVEINELGHRIDRLGEIIQGLRGGRK